MNIPENRCDCEQCIHVRQETDKRYLKDTDEWFLPIQLDLFVDLPPSDGPFNVGYEEKKRFTGKHPALAAPYETQPQSFPDGNKDLYTGVAKAESNVNEMSTSSAPQTGIPSPNTKPAFASDEPQADYGDIAFALGLLGVESEWSPPPPAVVREASTAYHKTLLDNYYRARHASEAQGTWDSADYWAAERRCLRAMRRT
jgi:hypothetical protein